MKGMKNVILKVVIPTEPTKVNGTKPIGNIYDDCNKQYGPTLKRLAE